MAGDWEDFTVELVCEANFEVGRSLPVRKGVEVFCEDNRHVKA